jgi:hypothetical protein
MTNENWFPKNWKYGKLYDDLIGYKKGKFHVTYLDESCERVFCKICNKSDFVIISQNCFTAVKCKKCLYEICIHEG